MLFLIFNLSLQENAKYCVTLVLKTNIYKSKLIDFQDFESLVFGAFLRKTLQQRGFSFAELPDISGQAVNSVLAGTI